MTTNCQACQNFNQGAGNRSCLKCNAYKYLLPRDQSVKAKSGLPSFIIDNIPDTKTHRTVYMLLRTLDQRQATILMQYHYLEMSHKEIAEYHSISKQRVAQIIAQALELSRKILSDPCQAL